MRTDKHRSKTEDEINQITERIIGAAFSVSNTLGCGFLEKVYENAMGVELADMGIFHRQQHAIQVYYRNVVVGEYIADLLVEEEIVVELKAVKGLETIHQAQLMNYLKACKRRFGLLLNFGKPKVEIKRLLNGY